MFNRVAILLTIALSCCYTGVAEAQVIEAEFTFVEDLNDDGIWDMLFIDVDGDGKIDEHLYHPEGFYFYSIWRGGVVDPIGKPTRKKGPSVDSRVLEKWMAPGKSISDLVKGFVEYMEKKKPVVPVPPIDP
ncbi:MAG: hypothetical protein P8J33_05350 [Pirellulaceae bacterium]|nr:hypothetical protein [Pirellulaceae bacterium]